MSPERAPRPTLGDILVAWRWPLALVLVAGIGLVVYFDVARRAERSAGAAAGTLRDAAASLLTGDVTEVFRSSIPEVGRAQGGLLEVATLDLTESFERTDERRVLWDQVSLGTAVSKIQVPVTYRYHVVLRDPWEVEIDGQFCRVVAPDIQPSLPPAIHTDRMEKFSEAGWLRLDADDQLAQLERGLTPRLSTRAGNPRHIALVRDQSRRTVAEFVREWLLEQGQWQPDRVQAIQVTFADEVVRADEPPPAVVESPVG